MLGAIPTHAQANRMIDAELIDRANAQGLVSVIVQFDSGAARMSDCLLYTSPSPRD